MTKCNGCFKHGKKLRWYFGERLCIMCRALTEHGEEAYEMDLVGYEASIEENEQLGFN